MGSREEESTIDTATPRRRPGTKTRHARWIAVAGMVLLVAVVCAWVPGTVGTAGAAALPWTGLLLLVLTVIAAVLARRVILLLLAPVLVWTLAMAPFFPGAAASTGPESLTVVSQNVRAHSGGAAASAAELAASGADVVALTELDAASLAVARETLAVDYPNSYAIGTVGIWSRLPIASTEPLSLGLGWNRALRVDVQSGDISTAVYVIHAASVRPGQQSDRDAMLSGLAAQIAADPAASIIAVGDFNAAPADPGLAALRAELSWVRPTDGTLGFTWPSAFPLARIDQVFVRGLDVASATTMRAGNSDHLATVTTVTVPASDASP